MAEAAQAFNLTPRTPFLPGQGKARELAEDPKGPTYVLLSGGMGSGKTYWLCWQLLRILFINLDWALRNGYRAADVKGLILSPTLKLLKKSVAPTLTKVMLEAGMAGRYRWNHQEGILRFDVGGGFDDGPLLYCYTAEQPDLIIGSDVCVAGIDEPGTPKSGEAFSRVPGRLRGPGLLRKVIMSGTPEDVISREWFYDAIASPAAEEKYGERGDNSRRIVFASTRENTYIPDLQSYVRGQQAVLSRQQALAYIEGRFVAFNTARVYSAFIDRSVDLGGHTIPEGGEGLKRPPRGAPMFITLDFNVDPMCGLVAYQHGQDGVRVIDEIRIPNAGDEEGKAPVTRWCEEFVRRHLERWDGPLHVHGDATEDRQTVAASRTGWELVHAHLEPVVRAKGLDYVDGVWGHNPREVDRVNTVNAAFEHGRILVAERCTHLRKDLNLVGWKEGTTAIDKSDHGLTHLSDALGYLIVQHAGFVATRESPPLPAVTMPSLPSLGERWDW